jgi:hypothetical protein
LHDGQWFSSANFRSLADGWSDKDPNQCIGHKGLGFRSRRPRRDRPSHPVQSVHAPHSNARARWQRDGSSAADFGGMTVTAQDWIRRRWTFVVTWMRSINAGRVGGEARGRQPKPRWCVTGP